ncbi:MAG: hypothetical protein ACTSR2_00775 [Candidatus Hodarchaeales archaeon]
MLTLRGKEGGKSDKPDRVAIKRISRNKEEFLDILKEFLIQKKILKDFPLRIYSSVNKRDLNKAIRKFKERQLEADYYAGKDRESFYIDIWNRWISCLMNPSSRAETKFLIDIDEKEKKDLIKDKLRELNIITYLEYPTKHGIHLITQPFNPKLITDSKLISEEDIKKDALLLLDF